MLFQNPGDVVLLIMQGVILLEVPVYFLPSVGALIKIFLRSSCHMVDVSWTKIMVIYDLVIHPSVTIFLGWIQVRTCI